MRNESQQRGWSPPERDARRRGTIEDDAPSWRAEPQGGYGGGPEYGPGRGPEYGPGRGPAYGHLGSRDWRGRWAERGDEPLGQNDDVPGYEWRDAGAATTTGRDFGPGGWPGSGRPRRDMGERDTSEPGPTRQWDQRRPPEEIEGLDRPDLYRSMDDSSGYRTPDWPERPPVRGRRIERFGDGRYGRPDEWSNRQSEWPGRPSRFEDANSGVDPRGAGMGAGMYWNGSSARQDDEIRGRVPTGRQIPERGRHAGEEVNGGSERRGPHAGRGPRGYRRSDERIAEDVSDRLTEDEYVDASDVAVTIQDGVVVLEGTVDSRDSRRRAEDIAYSVSGVVDVMNRLKLESGAGVVERIRNAVS